MRNLTLNTVTPMFSDAALNVHSYDVPANTTIVDLEDGIAAAPIMHVQINTPGGPTVFGFMTYNPFVMLPAPAVTAVPNPVPAPATLNIAAPTPVPAATELQPWSLQLVLTGTDATSTCDLNVAGMPRGMNVSNTGLVTWTPAAGDAGVYTVTANVHKGTETKSATFTVHCNAAPAPAPVRHNHGWLWVLGGVALALALAALIIGLLVNSRAMIPGPKGDPGPAGKDGIDGKDGVTTIVTKTVIVTVTEPTAAPTNTTTLAGLDYQDDDAGGCAASKHPLDFPACWLQKVQAGEITPVEAIVAIQKLAAASNVPSQDGWKTLTADEHSPMFVWCSGSNSAENYIPDTAFPWLHPNLETRWHYTVGIIQAHPASDPAAVKTVTCPSGDGWAVPLH